MSSTNERVSLTDKQAQELCKELYKLFPKGEMIQQYKSLFDLAYFTMTSQHANLSEVESIAYFLQDLFRVFNLLEYGDMDKPVS